MFLLNESVFTGMLISEDQPFSLIFNSQFFLNINNSFDHFFQHGLDNMGLVVAAPVHWINTYPEPIE